MWTRLLAAWCRQIISTLMLADKLLQSRILPRKVHEKTMSWIKGSEDQRLMGRACGLVFLINKLAGSNNEIGIKATIDTLADLLVEDLTQGSSALRSKLPGLLDKCELLIKVGDEYRIQTEEAPPGTMNSSVSAIVWPTRHTALMRA